MPLSGACIRSRARDCRQGSSGVLAQSRYINCRTHGGTPRREREQGLSSSSPSLSTQRRLLVPPAPQFLGFFHGAIDPVSATRSRNFVAGKKCRSAIAEAVPVVADASPSEAMGGTDTSLPDVPARAETVPGRGEALQPAGQAVSAVCPRKLHAHRAELRCVVCELTPAL